MKLNAHMFRGYDLRGVAGEDLTPEIVLHLGKVYGTYLRRHGLTEALIACDSRATSPEYTTKIVEGLNWAGINTVNIGMTFVGVFYWAQYFLQKKGGVYISASHNPPEYNGFKFAIDYSETLVSEGIQEVRKMAEADDIEEGQTKGTNEDKNITPDYLADLQKRFDIKKKFKIVVDPSCATGGAVVPPILRAFGMEVIESNCNVDPTFPVGTADPTETRVAQRVADKVKEVGADLGFSYDADGDRLGIVDENGGIIWNDVLLCLFAIDVLHYHPGAKVMFNTLCSKVVPETITTNGGEPFMWRTGHSFLKKKNQEVKAAMIGELSGHFFFSADFYNHDDSVFASLRVLNLLARTGRKLSEIVAELPLYVSSPEVKLFCPDDSKVELTKKMIPTLKQDFPSAEIIDDERAGDGIRLELPDGMFVVRYSQNGPYITVKFEGKTKERYEELRKYIADLLKKFPEIDWHNKINVNHEALE